MNFIKYLILSFIISSIFTEVDAQNKNVLLIIVDDLNTDQAAFGNDAVITPNIDALSREGIQFTNTQCSWPVCGPSRASFMTGTYPETNGVTNLSTELRDPSPNIVTIPQYLKEIGFTTEAVGKVYDPRSIDADYDYPTSWSTPYSISYSYPSEYGPFFQGQYRVSYPSSYNKGPLTEQGPSGVDDDGYIDGQISLDAISRIEDYKTNGKPFFLSVGFKKPHTPFIAPKKYWDMYDINQIELSPYQKLPQNTTDIAFSTSSEVKGYGDILDNKDGEFTSSVTVGGNTFDNVMEEAKQKKAIMGYYAAVTYIDAQIGKIIDALKTNGFENNTLIILTSDHGFALGDHGIWAKHNVLNNTSQVPFIIVDPNSSSKIETRAVQLIDIFPTICDWLNIPELEQMQGNSVFKDPNTITTFPLDLAVTHYKSSGKKGYSFKRGNYRYTLWTKQTPMSNTYNEMIPFTEEFYKYDSSKPQAVERENIIDTSDTDDKNALDNIKADVEIWWTAYFNNHTNESDIPKLSNNDDLKKLRFNLYPNPTSDFINISGDFDKETRIKVYQLDGRKFIDKSVKNIKENYSLDISSLKNGAYIVSVNGINYTLIKE